MKKIILVYSMMLVSMVSFAQTVDEVTLVATGSAETEQEAILIALRSAIEQTFGTFVSSNTTMVNDELIKDEIVSVSKGNVKNYEKLSSVVLPNGQTSVSLKATVCISKLISYAKSKGSSAEFAGQTFAMNMKLERLREKNTLAAYKQMCEQIILMAPKAFDFQIKLYDPSLFTDNAKESRSVSKYIEGLSELAKEKVLYRVPATLHVMSNAVTSAIYDLVNNTLNSLKLTDEEIRDRKQRNLNCYKININSRFWSGDIIASDNYDGHICLPINKNDVEEIHLQDVLVERSLIDPFFAYKINIKSDKSHSLSIVCETDEYIDDFGSKKYKGEKKRYFLFDSMNKFKYYVGETKSEFERQYLGRFVLDYRLYSGVEIPYGLEITPKEKAMKKIIEDIQSCRLPALTYLQWVGYFNKEPKRSVYEYELASPFRGNLLDGSGNIAEMANWGRWVNRQSTAEKTDSTCQELYLCYIPIFIDEDEMNSVTGVEIERKLP